jgi:alpha-L-fucosidase
MMRTSLRLSALPLLLLPVVPLPAPAQTDPGAPPEAIETWRARRFGMFIHWGPVSLKGTEIGWSRGAQVPKEEYDNLYTQFNPTRFDADAWVRVAKDAGMKYMVITSKHHDGFCIFDTKQTDYNIMNSPFKRDVLKELSEACRKGGIAFGTYYSVCDWHHPAFPRGSPGGRTRKPNPDLDAYTEYLRKQVTELIRNYGPLSTMWFDVPQEFNAQRGGPVVAMVRALQPDIVINNRCAIPADYDTPEQRVGGFKRERPWETCMTICRQWAWKPDDRMKSLQQCLQTLLYTAGGDGNLLFNVGPMPDGRIEPRQVERLKEMGAWLKKHGEGVYGTRGGPFRPGRWGAATCKQDKIFLFVMNWPEEESLRLPPIPAKVLSHKTKSGGTASVEQTGEGILVSLPAADRDAIATVIELAVEGKAFDIPPVVVTGGGDPVTLGKKARASNVFQNQGGYAAAKAVDENPDSRWATDAGTKSAWLEVDLGKPVAFDRVRIDEAYAGRVRRFELQVKEGENWKTILTGTTIGADFEKRFDPVTARVVRLNILEATEGPTINVFELYPPRKKK